MIHSPGTTKVSSAEPGIPSASMNSAHTCAVMHGTTTHAGGSTIVHGTTTHVRSAAHMHSAHVAATHVRSAAHMHSAHVAAAHMHSAHVAATHVASTMTAAVACRDRPHWSDECRRQGDWDQDPSNQFLGPHGHLPESIKRGRCTPESQATSQLKHTGLIGTASLADSFSRNHQAVAILKSLKRIGHRFYALLSKFVLFFLDSPG
jgi:hypothetical protein